MRCRWLLAAPLISALGCAEDNAESDAGPPQTCAAVEAGDIFSITPYLHNVTTTAAEIAFATTTSQTAMEVRVAARGTEGCTAALLNGAERFVVSPTPGEPTDLFLYRANISYPAASTTRRLCYGVRIGQQLYCSDDRDFTAPGTDGDAFSFFVYGDNRARFPEPDRTPVVNADHQEVVAAMQTRLQADRSTGSSPASFVFDGGDFAYCGCELDYWRYNFFTPAGPLLGQLPIYTVPGNHEYEHNHCIRCPDAALYQRFFPLPTAGEMHVGPEQMVRFDYHNVRFISMKLIHFDDSGCCISWQPDPGEDCPPDPGGAPPGTDPWCSPTGCRSCSADEACCLQDGSAAWTWLSTQLREASDNDTIDHVLIFHHAPLLSAPPADDGHPTSEYQVNTLVPLFEKPDGTNHGKVAAVFNSHNHFYERSISVDGLRMGGTAPSPVPEGFRFPTIEFNADADHGITYIVTGGGGADLYETPQEDPTSGIGFPIAGWLAAARSARHYLKITIDGPNACGQAVFTDGSPADAFTLRGTCP